MKKYCDSNLYRSVYSKQFCNISFFLNSYNLTKKWNLDIDIFQVLTYCNFPNFSLIEIFY